MSTIYTLAIIWALFSAGCMCMAIAVNVALEIRDDTSANDSDGDDDGDDDADWWKKSGRART